MFRFLENNGDFFMMIGSGGAGKEPLILAAIERRASLTSQTENLLETGTAMTACNSISVRGSRPSFYMSVNCGGGGGGGYWEA